MLLNNNIDFINAIIFLHQEANNKILRLEKIMCEELEKEEYYEYFKKEIYELEKYREIASKIIMLTEKEDIEIDL